MSRREASLLCVAALVLAGCSGQVEPGVTTGIDACRECNMVIDQANQAAGYMGEGEFVPFDSPMCLLRHLDALRKQGGPLPGTIYLADHGDSSFHPAEEMTLLLTRHQRTVMDGGVVCFHDRKAAEALVGHEDEVLTDWNGYRAARGEPDRELELSVGPDGMSPEVLAVSKGDLVLFRVTGVGLEEDWDISVTGYPEAGTLTLPSSGEEVSLRLLALRPGAGFPVVRAGSDQPLGMLKVAGAHTADEEAM